MENDKLYRKAVEDMKELVDDITFQLDYFANEYNYEKQWVFNMFRELFNRKYKKFFK